jgi:hypothetical protein
MRFNHLIQAVTILTANLYPLVAEAEYLRFWRGNIKPGLSEQNLIDGLNRSLFPATGELAKTEAQLLSYQPVVLEMNDSIRSYPEEVALLRYGSEEAYRSYRSTPAGVHYGNLHWDLFDAQTSGSLVPGRFDGFVEFEKAYELSGSGRDWNSGDSYFQVWLRQPGQSDHEFLANVRNYLREIQNKQPFGYVALVAKDYVLEYQLLRPDQSENIYVYADLMGAERVQVSHLPRRTSIVRAESGITYPVNASSEAPTVRETWERHIRAWAARDLDAIVADYSHDAVVILNDEIYRGQDEIRALFAKLFQIFEAPAVSGIDRIIIEQNTVYLLWNIRPNRPELSNQSFFGTDTFFIQSGMIKLQTISSDRKLWQH